MLVDGIMNLKATQKVLVTRQALKLILSLPPSFPV